ncbi:hypothetical protein GCM10010172_72540 [Paractinoplanes ferrugineus]|uniref:Uncharacterized protein n=1 Tax=Paractinoplanes ferrugineus TaxID=113564 RepID=A0A919IYT9_9ACTN|nr:hypothetical protein [Actinoplanes ferrugineus]GIE11591.1 hypothetical protein Afe05nite_34310 [Actinoplanes ferrugineus]
MRQNPELTNKTIADYHQIHVFDEGPETHLGDEWTGRATDDHLAAGPVAVGTTVEVNIAVRASSRLAAIAGVVGRGSAGGGVQALAAAGVEILLPDH